MIYTQIQTQCKFQADPTVTAKRWFRVDKKVVEVNMPGLIKDYNKNMGFVDLIDQMVALYRVRIRKRKWWWCLYSWSLSANMVNAWRLMRYVKNDKSHFLDFLRSTVMETLKIHGTDRLRPGPALVLRGVSKEYVRRDGKDHWIV